MSRRKRYTRNFGRLLKTPSPMRTTVEWVRFEHEREPFGVFCYLKDARAASAASACAEIETINRWFHIALDAPDTATRAESMAASGQQRDNVESLIVDAFEWL
jgi:hypothetical protein